MRLDASYLHFISKQEIRVLQAIEIGMKNHQIVPTQLIVRIANLRGGETYKILRKLLKNKLVAHTGKNYDGYKLTYLGYDYLALKTFLKRGLVKDVIMKIGVGKQSDVYKCITPQGEYVVLKLTRLGRTDNISSIGQVIVGSIYPSFLRLDNLVLCNYSIKYISQVNQNGFPTPKPIDTNRHAILMSLIDGYPLCHVRGIGPQISTVFSTIMKLVVKLGNYGLVHGDFNQFNLMVNDQGQVTIIDFPQCISIKHPNAKMYFNRDIECLYTFFEKLAKKSQDIGDFDVVNYQMPNIDNINLVKRLDHQAKALGHFTLAEEKQLETVYGEVRQNLRGQQDPTQQENEEEQQEDQQQDQQEDQQENQQDKNKDQQQQQGQQQNEGKNEKKDKYQIKHNQGDYICKSELQNEKIFCCTEEIINKQICQQQIQQNSKELQLMMAQFQVEGKQGKPDQQKSQSQQDPQYKGLTNYQIRLKIKQKKRLEREAKKAQVSTTQYIRNALRKPAERVIQRKGNYGKKNKNKNNLISIKQGLEY